MRLFGLTVDEWSELVRRVSRGVATHDDAGPVRLLGLDLQADRIQTGISTHTDATLISLEVHIQMLSKTEVAA